MFLMENNSFLVTRSTSKYLQRSQYDRPCKIEIPLNETLNQVARSLRPLHRQLSVGNLAQVDSPQVSPPRPAVPKFDIAKIRSILKNPIGKPKSIIGRRKSMGARVNFQHVDVVARQTSEDVADLIDLSEQNENRCADDSTETNPNGTATPSVHLAPSESDSGSQSQPIDVFDPIPSTTGTVPPNNQSLLESFDWNQPSTSNPQ